MFAKQTVLAAIGISLALFVQDARAQTLSEARAIAKDVTIYGFPLIDNYRIQYSYFADRGSPEYKGTRHAINALGQ